MSCTEFSSDVLLMSVSNVRYRISIAGGFAFVFVAQDSSNGRTYALKVCDSGTRKKV